jgi:tripeptide aminopeptidase
LNDVSLGFFLLLTLSSQPIDYDAEVRAIAARPEIQKAFDVIVELEPQSERDLIELTEIPAPPFKEDARGARFAAMLREAGMERVSIDEVGNVLAEWPGTEGAETLAVVAHLDTVFPEGTDVTVRREGNRLFAPGVGDNSRGLALVLTMIRAMIRADVKTRSNVLFVGSVGEEGLGDLRGVKHLLREGGPKIDQFIAIDGGRAQRITTHAIGSHRYRVTFKGPGGHSWGDFGYANPAHALARAIYYFDQEAGEYVIDGPKTSYNIGRIGGGTSVNAIPFENWAEVDMRSGDPARLTKIDEIFHRSVQRALDEQNELRQRGDALTVDIDMVGDRPSGTTDPESPLIQRAMAATRFFGFEPELGSGSTDANVPISLGIPAITIDRGGEGDRNHSLEEWWSNADGYIGIQKALLLTVSCAGPAD